MVDHERRTTACCRAFPLHRAEPFVDNAANPLDHRFDTHTSGIDRYRIRPWPQWGHGPGRVAPTALRDIPQKGCEITTASQLIQLLIAPPAAFLPTGGAQNLASRIPKNPRDP